MTVTVTNEAALKKINNLADVQSIATAVQNLGLIIGTDVQAQNAILQSLTEVGGGANTLPFFTAANTFGEISFPALGQDLVEQATAAGAQTLLQLTPGQYTAFQPLINSQSANYTLSLADFQAGIVVFNSSSAITVTIPQHSSVAIPAGYSTVLLNLGSGTLTVVKSGSDSLFGNTTLSQYAAATVVCTTAGSPNTFVVNGATQTQTSTFSIMIPAPTNGLYFMALKPGFSGSLVSMSGVAQSGSCTAGLEISSVGVGGGSMGITSTTATNALISANTFTGSDLIELLISGASSCVNMNVTVQYTRTF